MNDFIKEYEELCKKHKMNISWDDQKEYYVESEEEFFSYFSLKSQIDNLKLNNDYGKRSPPRHWRI